MSTTFSKNPVYLSTGAFTGRINGRNYRLALEFAEKLDCDGYEFLMMPDFYDKMDMITNDYTSYNLKIPVMHFDKATGNFLSSPGSDNMQNALDMIEKNCIFACGLGAKKAVIHIWGIPDSDGYFDLITERVDKCLEITKSYGIELLMENCFCKNNSPLSHMEALAKKYKEAGFTADTRCAQFHNELENTCKSPIWNKNIRHIHVNDYSGGYMDWNAMYPILQPPLGNVDWDMFFGYIKNTGYCHTFTLEAPSMLENGVDTATLNKGIKFIRDRL